jgi:hypothetical protein
VNRFAAPPAAGESSKTFRAGKSERLFLRQSKLQRREAGKHNQTG